MKTFQEFLLESTSVPFHERLTKENPNTIRFIHAMALGHKETDAYDIAEKKGEIKPPQNPTQHSYRRITDSASGFHYPDGDKTLDLKSVRRLIHGPLQVPKRDTGPYDYRYETKIKKAGGIDKVLKQRQAGAGDAQIFKGQERRSVKRLRSYIESKYKDHPDYAARNKPKQEMASQSMIDAIMKRKAQGHSHRQIAKDLNVTPGRIAGLIHRNKK